ncbi:hypothetical protein BGZ82_001185, partial [Podila clonocystis]
MTTPTRQSQRIRVKVEKESETKSTLDAQLVLEGTKDRLKRERGAETSTQAKASTNRRKKTDVTDSKAGSSKSKGKKRPTADEQENDQDSTAHSVTALKPKRKKYSRISTHQTPEIKISKDTVHQSKVRNPVKPKRPYVRRKKVAETGNESTSNTEADDKEAEPVKTKRVYTKRKKVEGDVGVKIEEEDAVIKQEEGEGIKTEQINIVDIGRPAQKKRPQIRASTSKGKAKADDHGSQTTEATGTPEKVPVPTNPQDPCSVFPTELWHAVLDYLPLSVVANTSIVCNTWLTAARAYNGWRIAAEKGGMGAPKTKYKSWMALVCSHSDFVCDRCMGFSNGKGRASHIPLPVIMNDDDTIIWHMCWEC